MLVKLFFTRDIIRGDIVRGGGGFCPVFLSGGGGVVLGGYCPGDIVRGDIVLEPASPDTHTHTHTHTRCELHAEIDIHYVYHLPCTLSVVAFCQNSFFKL